MHKITTIILLFVLAVPFNWNLSAQNSDINTLVKLNQIESTKGYSTFISQSTTAFGVGIPIVMGAISLIDKNDDLLKNALYIASSEIVDEALTSVLKVAINRPRPFVTYPDLIDPYQKLTSMSMPSGHTSFAFSAATSLSIKYPKWYVIVPSYAWACSVGYSRMNLGVHYPSDVIAGALLGAGSAYLTNVLNKWFWKKENNKKILTSKKDSSF